jgi:RHS repeat-associated protein
MTATPSHQLIACDRSNSVIQRASTTHTRATTFSAFGYCATAPDDEAALGFNGQLQECNGAYLLGSYRAYLPWLKRFASPDSLSPFGAIGFCVGAKMLPKGYEMDVLRGSSWAWAWQSPPEGFTGDSRGPTRAGACLQPRTA